ncbi:23S rRNA (guanosine(2251)-2'-O)-methyltransferase RlmB, partial [Agathobaculum sp.]|uniref:23S rRNA (guanosine(2251)-2'-O)-methyltransferase RlmB n=1 Tax=Agathobaculum sp. TaxID=2048138 RepID=UPI0039A3081B
AIIRSAETAGAHGVIIPKRRAVGLTAAVARAAAGALAYIGVHKANNLAATLDELKERGVWLFGAEADGNAPLYEAAFDRPTAIVIGSEGQGLSRLTRDKCDYIVSIPMRGRVNSLNASNAAAVLLFEAVRRRTTAD